MRGKMCLSILLRRVRYMTVAVLKKRRTGKEMSSMGWLGSDESVNMPVLFRMRFSWIGGGVL